MALNGFNERTVNWAMVTINENSTKNIEVLTTTDAYNMTADCFRGYVDAENLTDCNHTNISSSMSDYSKPSEGTPMWKEIFYDVQVVCLVIGMATNLFTFITLFLNSVGFSRVILTLLRHQALVDFFVCAMASTLILQPSHRLTGIYRFDVFVCYAWHSQALYWGGVTASTYNLILVAFERCLAVRKPLRHKKISVWSRAKFAKVFFALYALTLMITHGRYTQTRLTENDCLDEYAFEGPSIRTYFFFFVIFTYLSTYLIPALLIALCYGTVIRYLRLRVSDRSLGRSRQLDLAISQLTKSAIAMTVIFICTVGYELHYYLLGYTGVVVYQLNTPIQKVGVFLSNINSSITPFLYAAVMPIVKRSVIRTLLCRAGCRTNANGSQNNNV